MSPVLQPTQVVLCRRCSISRLNRPMTKYLTFGSLYESTAGREAEHRCSNGGKQLLRQYGIKLLIREWKAD